MNKPKPHHIAFILYDSIKNSVFTSQVLNPLLKKILKNNRSQATLISFEKETISKQDIARLIPHHPHLTVVFFRRLPLFGMISLLPSCWQLRSFLKTISPSEIVARGPIAGYLALHPRKKIKKIPFTIQARGLCAEEYRFAQQHTPPSFLKTVLNRFLYRRLWSIERNVYGNKQVHIESVSPALKTYLVETFHANEKKISIAHDDIPRSIDTKTKQVWRWEIRHELKISPDHTVYAYSGSAQPWQCAEETVSYFLKRYQENPKSFLLILSQDQRYFEMLLGNYHVPVGNYHVTCAHPDEVYRYLAACDIGILFRKKDIINWVSRPTKMLEYQSVGLRIAHNNTIALLSDQHRSS